MDVLAGLIKLEFPCSNEIKSLVNPLLLHNASGKPSQEERILKFVELV